MISPLLHASEGITIICTALSGSFSLAAQAVTETAPVNSPFSLKNKFPAMRSLSIGDKMPAISFENVLNNKSKKAKLSGFKDKLICLLYGVYGIHFAWLHLQKMEAVQMK